MPTIPFSDVYALYILANIYGIALVKYYFMTRTEDMNRL